MGYTQSHAHADEYDSCSRVCAVQEIASLPGYKFIHSTRLHRRQYMGCGGSKEEPATLPTKDTRGSLHAYDAASINAAIAKKAAESPEPEKAEAFKSRYAHEGKPKAERPKYKINRKGSIAEHGGTVRTSEAERVFSHMAKVRKASVAAASNVSGRISQRMSSRASKNTSGRISQSFLRRRSQRMSSTPASEKDDGLNRRRSSTTLVSFAGVSGRLTRWLTPGGVRASDADRDTKSQRQTDGAESVSC